MKYCKKNILSQAQNPKQENEEENDEKLAGLRKDVEDNHAAFVGEIYSWLVLGDEEEGAIILSDFGVKQKETVDKWFGKGEK